jgi:hypothetical protein
VAAAVATGGLVVMEVGATLVAGVAAAAGAAVVAAGVLW